MAIKQKTQLEHLKSIDLSLKTLNDFYKVNFLKR